MRRGLALSLAMVFVLAAGSLAATLLSGHSPQLGLDLQGGISVVLQPREEAPSAVIDQAIEIIRSRVDALGVAEPEISRQGDNVIVQLPGVRNRERALALIGTTAQLYFRPVLQQLPASESATATTTTSSTTPAGEGAAGEGATATAVPATTTTTMDPTRTTPPEENDPAKQVVLPERRGEAIAARYLLGPAEVTGQALSEARATMDATTAVWRVEFSLTGEGARQWNEMAAKVGVGGQIAIDLDGEVRSAPSLQTTNFPGEGQITGNFTEREAKDLALVLRYGALPVQLDRQTVQTVSASLGRDSLRAGVGAGLVGLGLVAVYMVLYYRALGLVVLLGLLVTGALMYSIVSWLGQTTGLALTLAGATGIVVSVGVTVDSYIVYFERLKEEIRAGKSVRSSVERSFRRAYRTILIADIASLIGAAVLYQLSVGSVRGFAFFLGLSVLLDIFIAYFFTRPVVVLLGQRGFGERGWLGVGQAVRTPSGEPLVKAGV